MEYVTGNQYDLSAWDNRSFDSDARRNENKIMLNKQIIIGFRPPPPPQGFGPLGRYPQWIGPPRGEIPRSFAPFRDLAPPLKFRGFAPPPLPPFSKFLFLTY